MTHTIPLEIPGMPGAVAKVPTFTCELPDGRTGYYQRRLDDCLRASLATALQVPYEDVPDWPAKPGTTADELADWEAVWDWAASLGYRLRFHNRPPEGCDTYLALDTPQDRFRHVVAVMAGHFFDPGSGIELPGWLKREPMRPINYVITLTRKAPRCSESA